MKTQNFYELEHPVYGIWYATSGYKAVETIGCTLSYFYQRRKVTNKIKGWTVTEVKDLDDVPYCWIDKPFDRIKEKNMKF